MKNVAEILNGLGREIDSIYIRATKMNGRGGLYHRMQMLKKKSGFDDWKSLRGPVWIGDYIVTHLFRPRDDDAGYNQPRRRYPGECTNSWVKGNR